MDFLANRLERRSGGVLGRHVMTNSNLMDSAVILITPDGKAAGEQGAALEMVRSRDLSLGALGVLTYLRSEHSPERLQFSSLLNRYPNLERSVLRGWLCELVKAKFVQMRARRPEGQLVTLSSGFDELLVLGSGRGAASK